MTATHNWTISGLYAHPLNANCLYKIVASLSSTDGANTLESEYDFYVAPNILPEVAEDEISDPEASIIWVDSQPGFVPMSNLKESDIWSWVDERYDRSGFEAEHEKQLQPTDTDVPVPLPW